MNVFPVVIVLVCGAIKPGVVGVLLSFCAPCKSCKVPELATVLKARSNSTSSSPDVGLTTYSKLSVPQDEEASKFGIRRPL